MAVDGCRGMVSTSTTVFRVQTREDATNIVFWLSHTMLATPRIAGCHPQQRSSIVRSTRYEDTGSQYIYY